jgi:hypothetical protein
MQMRLHSIVRGTRVLPATIRRARSAQAGVHRNVASRSAQPARAMLEQLVTEKDERLHTSNSNSENGPKVASEPGAPATPGEDDRKRFQLVRSEHSGWVARRYLRPALGLCVTWGALLDLRGSVLLNPLAALVCGHVAHLLPPTLAGGRVQRV